MCVLNEFYLMCVWYLLNEFSVEGLMSVVYMNGIYIMNMIYNSTMHNIIHAAMDCSNKDTKAHITAIS